MSKGKYLSKKARKRSPLLVILIFCLLVVLAAAAALILAGCTAGLFVFNHTDTPTDSPSETTTAPADPTESTPPPTTEPIPTEPYVAATASIGVTGDVMGHMPVINAGKTATGYDYSTIYTYIQPYYESFDFMVANLEVNLGGTEGGPYQGYPTFNSPDEMAQALKNAGVDMVLTANNHSYDIGHKSFHRTQNVLTEMGLDYLGTKLTEDTPLYKVQDINGIKVGMVCYTYETGDPANSRKQLNGINMTEEDSLLIGSFNYNDLDGFYADVQETLNAMYAEGAQATMIYIHWGDEYLLKPNANQTKIAQQLCELGVDVIVGGHPHVIEPFEMLTSSTGHNTYCIYSVGNAISNQRATTLSVANAQYTEDGMIFNVVFEMWNDGSVNVSQINILPTWVNKFSSGGKWTYRIIPLDTELETWDSFESTNTSTIYRSYERTMSIVGEGLNTCRETLGLPVVALTADTE